MSLLLETTSTSGISGKARSRIQLQGSDLAQPLGATRPTCPGPTRPTCPTMVASCSGFFGIWNELCAHPKVCTPRGLGKGLKR